MPNIGIYAGSFDPITKGHELVIAEVSDLFDELIVAVAHNQTKKYMFSVDERVSMVESVTYHLPKVKVIVIDSNTYLVDFASEIGAQYLVRGLRSESDFKEERINRDVNKDFNPFIKTIFVMPDPDIAKVSSSMVKAIIGPNGWQDKIARYVSEPVRQAIIRRHNES